jgi:hypothetical protein
VEEHLKPALHAAITFLEESGYRYAVIGGLAMAEWGALRYTHDVDFKVLVPDMDYGAVRVALRAAFPERARVHVPENPLIVAVNIGEVIVDFLLALPGYEELIITRAVKRAWGDLSAWVCSAEDLIIQKVVAGRGKDWLDVESLLEAQRGKLDEAYIAEWLAQFAEALEKPELLTEYQRLLRRSKQADD